MNQYYTYDNMFLWDDETWKDRNGELEPLIYHLYRKNYALRKGECSVDFYADHADTALHVKTNSFVFQDVVDAWETKGLHYHCTGMGGINWIAMVPRLCMEGKLHKPTTLVVPVCTDIENPRWAMNILKYYEDLNNYAAENNMLVLYLCQGIDDCKGVYVDIMLEVCSIFRTNFSKAYIDLTGLHAAGETLEDVPGLDRNAFGQEETLAGLPVVSIADLWESTLAHQQHVRRSNRRKAQFDAERLKHSTVGHRMTDGMRVEYDYDRNGGDPLQKARWAKMGLVLDEHYTEEERWLTMTPKAALETPDKKIPLFLIFKEVRDASDFMTLTAFQFYYDFIEIASQGEFMMLFFAMESADDNELLTKLIEEAKAAYPVDPSRIYLVGQSHNGYLGLEFARRHIEQIAGIATLSDRPGIADPAYSTDNVVMTDEMLKTFETHDLPLINFCGIAENVFQITEPGTKAYDQYIDSFRRRLRAMRCPDRSPEEILAARSSKDLAERANGIPSDRSEVRYAMGTEAYICDFKNNDGNWHLRMVTLENLPHMISPVMAEIAWSFLRRFARDPESGAILERY